MKNKHNAPLIMGIFFVVLMVSAGVLYYFAAENRGPGISLYANLKGYFETHRIDHGAPSPALASFSGLQQDFIQGGIQQFKEKKKVLRSEVETVLENNSDDSAEHDTAENIAVYLFPDLLERDDFEREVAFDQWFSQEKSIETDPNSPESRKEFEELKNNIWNYENPDRNQPSVSDYAEQVIKIYDALSKGE